LCDIQISNLLTRDVGVHHRFLDFLRMMRVFMRVLMSLIRHRGRHGLTNWTIHHESEVGSPTLADGGDTMTTDIQLLLSVEEAADVLRLGRTRTYELVMTKRIQSVKVGRRRLVVRSSLFDFVQTLLLEQDSA
jgi:excisionase family DNA binding protein